MYRFDFNNKNLFIGAIADGEIIKILNSEGSNVSTGYNVERKMLDGLEELGYYSDTITAHVSPALNLRTFVMDLKSQNRNKNVTDISISFLNLPLLDKLIKAVKISNASRCWVKKREKPFIFVYSLGSYFLIGALAAKRKNSQCRIIAIVPDLPEYMSNSQNKIYRFLKRIDRNIIDYCIKKIDGFVLFAEPMKNKLPIDDKPYVVVEGIIKEINKEEYIKRIENKAKDLNKIIMLSGNLDCEEGIPMLLEAFSKIENQEYKLWLTGTGNSVGLIKDYAKRDPRVSYFGYIDSYEEFLKLQQQAQVFVLMVSPQHSKSAYYFPSKLMEYLVTGGLVACFKLDCIPNEYDEYLEYFEESTDKISRKLIDLCEMNSETYIQKAIKRYLFLEQKGPKMQMKKVEELQKNIKDFKGMI